jgi:hypothetical protein
MCEYLYAAFSLNTSAGPGLRDDQLGAPVASLPVWLAARRSTGLLRIELHAYAGALLELWLNRGQCVVSS